MKNFKGSAVSTENITYNVNKVAIVNNGLYINISPLHNSKEKISLLYSEGEWFMRNREEENKFNVKYLYKKSDIIIKSLNLINNQF